MIIIIISLNIIIFNLIFLFNNNIMNKDFNNNILLVLKFEYRIIQNYIKIINNPFNLIYYYKNFSKLSKSLSSLSISSFSSIKLISLFPASSSFSKM